ncbi:hypothetical protein RI129_004820 [Pyrocoelia pectoralis]|uniref:CRAL-TRIO domain-containing protein n=1 Tax=Pyrocoelia pectoralis TaxID=417401 RepID=A0AAN7ZRH6_9COLE
MGYRELSPVLQEIAEKELNENSSRIREDLEYIRDWINKEPHLNARTDDQFLLSFLRGCKFSLHRTQAKLDYYYTVKTIVTELFSNRDPYDRDIQEALRFGSVLPLPNTEYPGGPRIILLRSSVLNSQNNFYLMYFKILLMMLDVLLLEDDNFTVSGVIFWSDGRNTSMRDIMHLTPALLKKMQGISEKAYPLRMKAVHSTSCPPMAESLFNLSKSLAPAKQSQRMFMYSEANHEQFCKKIPIQLQPQEYGGENGSVKTLTEIWKNKIESYSKWFLEDMQYGTNEELRTGAPKTSANLFGVEGTFRKLDID